MRNGTIQIGARGSELSLWQANWVLQNLTENHPGLESEILVIKTTGDTVQDRPISSIGTTGVFTKELDTALIEGRIDIAVHSLKDVPTVPVEGLVLAAVPERESANDVLLCNKATALGELPPGAIVGTSSMRRKAQLYNLRPELVAKDIRGNVDTRIRKLHQGDEYDAVILAYAGVKRLGREAEIVEILSTKLWVPAPAQGALGIIIREGDRETSRIIEPLNHRLSEIRVIAERSFLAKLGVGCKIPLGAHATIENEEIILDGLVAKLDGSKVFRDSIRGAFDEAEQLGYRLGEKLLSQGARECL